MALIRALLLLVGLTIALGYETKKVDMLMPAVSPQNPDTYLCIPLKLSLDKSTYIVGFEPHANKKVAHHILLYGCDAPGMPDTEVWNCGGMEHPSYKSAGTCGGAGSKGIIYAWAYDADGLTLPQDVGFKVGGNTGINYLVLQLHYKDVTDFLPPKNGKDSSGITLVTTEAEQPNRAGVMLLGTGGRVPPKSVEYMETACQFDENFPVYPFAFRTHAHMHGRVITGYVIKDGVWNEIGRKDPRKPEMFYNATSPSLSIKPGDYMAARCTMENNEERTVNIGGTHNDEMCNFYIMFYTPGDKTTAKSCWTAGPPSYYWDASGDANLFKPENAPKTTSIEPESGKEYKITTRSKAAVKDEPVIRDEPVEDGMIDVLANMRESNDDRKFINLLRRLDATYRRNRYLGL